MLYLCWFMCTVKYVYRLISLEREAIGVKEVLKLRSCYRQFTAAVVPTGVLPLSPAPLPFRVFFLPRFTYSRAGGSSVSPSVVANCVSSERPVAERRQTGGCGSLFPI